MVVGRPLPRRGRKIRNAGRRHHDRRHPDPRRSPRGRPTRLYGRDPFPLPAEFPGEAGRGARCDHPSHVPGKGPGRVRDRLRAALRAQSLQDARCPDRARCRRLPRLARGGGGRRAARVRPGGQGSPVGLGMEEVRAVSTRAQALAEAAQPIHPPPTSFWRQYVFSIDHKVIAKQFLWAGLLFLLLGGTLAMLIRWQWAYPYRPVPVLGQLFLRENGGIIGPATYQQIFTTHGLIMIFFAVTPVLIGCFGNFLIPLMIGARDMAFPKLNMYSFWTFLLSQLLVLASFLTDLGSAGAGWTTYPPLSTNVGMPGLGQTLVVAAIFVTGVSSTMGAINYVTTVIRMRAPGMGYMRLPLTIWGLWLTAILNALFVPVLGTAALLLLLDRNFGTQFFVAGASAVRGGGDPILFQHLFWIFGHPEVYILILPPWGFVTDLVSFFARKPAYWYRGSIFAMSAVTVLSAVVYGHHMFVTGMNPMLGQSFQLLTLIISVPAELLFLNWLHTIWKGSNRFDSPMIYAIGVIFVFGLGGLTGLPLGTILTDL